MDNWLNNLLHKEYKIGKMQLSFLHLMFIFGITLTTMIMRWQLRDNETWDYYAGFGLWVDMINEAGGFKGLAGDFYDYTPMYVFIVWLFSFLPIKLLYVVKGFSVIFDVIMAFTSAKIVYDITRNRTRAVGIYGIMLILPTVANNSAMWCQCDVIYTTAILWCIYFLMNDKPAKGMFFYGIAFALKLQSVFVLPALIVLWAMKKIDLKHFLFMPLMYCVGILPAFLAGRSIKSLLSIYFVQAEKSPQLSLGYPNIYQMLGTKFFLDEYSAAGIWLTLGILMFMMYYIAKSGVIIKKEFIIVMFLLFELTTMCFMPFLHERYAYLGDLLTVILAFVFLEKFYVALIQQLISYSAYSVVLSAYVNVPIVIYSALTLFLVLDLGYSVYRYIQTGGDEKVLGKPFSWRMG